MKWNFTTAIRVFCLLADVFDLNDISRFKSKFKITPFYWVKITPFYWVKIQNSPLLPGHFLVNVARFARHSKIESCVQVMQSSKVALKTGF